MKNLRLRAQEISRHYKKNPKVESVLLGGSVARNWHDEFSDIELFVLWKEGPTDEERMAPVKAVDGQLLDFYPYEDEEWSETYITKGVKLEISNFLTKTVSSFIRDVTLSFDTGLDKQCVVATVRDGITLREEDGVIAVLKEKAAVYPPELREAMLRENSDLGSRWNNREALLYRQDWLMLFSVMVSVQTKLMGILFALNRQYVHHPAFKWQHQTLRGMALKPERAVERFNSVLLGSPEDAINEMEALIHDVYELVKQEYMHLDLSGRCL
ncbi:DUF4037 domain-containing protein [Bacillus sp. H-16]|uniref:DUF4037 domain-containing protein n=1 Tax=Alteribacter salitolerans TaxID=2912333 RepID=UPI00196470B2|nr:DUF4037 domain-containing protein [Alteribacter salitolerans]MBM7095251.1 DUF4037 domain-containing protein [Alteribacter salitolerans]